MTPKWTMAAIAAVALSGCGGSRVPDVAGLSETEASAKLSKAGLHTGAVKFDLAEESHVGKVLAQTPAAGGPVSSAPGQAVDLVLGGIATPKLIDTSAEKAALELRRQGLALGNVRSVAKITGNGLVSEQNPMVGAPVRRGTPVDITVTTPVLVDVARSVFVGRLRATEEFKKLPEADRLKIEQALQQ